MTDANARRAANRPDEKESAECLAEANVGGQHDADYFAALIIAAPPPEDLMVALAYLHGELSHGFFGLMRRLTGMRHD